MITVLMIFIMILLVKTNLIKIFGLSSKLLWFVYTVKLSIESGFSINSSIMVENLREESLSDLSMIQLILLVELKLIQSR